MTAPVTPASAAPTTNTLALIGFIAVFFVPVVGIVLGLMARRQSQVTREGGAGLARAAYILGVLGTLFQVGFFVVWLTMMLTLVSHPPTP